MKVYGMMERPLSVIITVLVCFCVLTPLSGMELSVSKGEDQDQAATVIKMTSIVVPIVRLGGALYRDENLSLNQNQSCMTCHHPSAGFADPDNRISPELFPVSAGSVPGLFGGRNAPSAAYAGFTPVFHFDPAEGLFIGGTFWDGRATGFTLGDPLAEQALGPFLNPVEMALPDEATVVGIVQMAEYADLFERVFGPDAFADVHTAYNNIGIAISAFEKSDALVKFKSKFDRFLAEQGGDVSNFGVEVQPDGFRLYVGPPEDFRSSAFTWDEADGLALFNADSDNVGSLGRTGGMCYACHLTENFDEDTPPIFTDFTFDNLGIPVNPRIAELAGPQPIDYGLGARIAELEIAFGGVLPKSERPDGIGGTVWVVDDEVGKFKVSSLRNLERTAPYGHNGFFATIYDIVHFYNTRDVDPMWPPAEVPDTVNGDELGNLGLTYDQELNIVEFMETLTR